MIKDKKGYEKMNNIFLRQGIQSMDIKEGHLLHLETTPQAVNTVNSKTVLEKWTVYVKPYLKIILQVYAKKNKKKDYKIIEEALSDFIKNHNIE